MHPRTKPLWRPKTLAFATLWVAALLFVGVRLFTG